MIILAQTDTTAGFLSTSEAEINAAKGRLQKQKCIKTFGSCAAAKSYARVAAAAKNLARRGRGVTILVGEKSLRICSGEHAKLLRALEKFGFAGMYSSSANAHGAGFCLDYALNHADLLAVFGGEGADGGIFMTTLQFEPAVLARAEQGAGFRLGEFYLISAKAPAARQFAEQQLHESAPSSIYKFRGRRVKKIR